MTVNPRIKEVLQSFNIPVDDGILYLLAIHFNLKPVTLPDMIITRVLTTGIVNHTPKSGVVWTIPLFEENELGKWTWVVDEYMQLFAEKLAIKKGPKKDTIARMQKFFSENPDVRKEDVLGATKMYIASVNDPKYLMMSHYFIFKDKAAQKTHNLEMWVENYKAANTSSVASEEVSITNKLQ